MGLVIGVVNSYGCLSGARHEEVWKSELPNFLKPGTATDIIKMRTMLLSGTLCV